MGFFGSVKRFGEKALGSAEQGSRIGQKFLGNVSRVGNKVASGIRSVQKGVAQVPILNKVADVPIYRGVSANQAANAAAGAAQGVASAADKARQGLELGDKLIRGGRELGAARTAGEAIATAKDMMRTGQQIQKMRP